MDLTNEQWARVEPLIPLSQWKPGGQGRPPRASRDVLDGILWVLRTGAPWQDMPDRYPSDQTCHRRFQQWTRAGVFQSILAALADDLAQMGGVDLREGFVDGSFAPATKGALLSARPNGAKAARPWPLQTALVFVSPCTWTALRRTK